MQHRRNDTGSAPVTATDLCAREPIHVPGAIQPHGALVCVSPDDLLVLNVSRNAPSMLSADLSPGRPLAFDPALQADLIGWSASGAASYRRQVERPGQSFQLSGHRTSQGLLLEFESVLDDPDEAPDRAYEDLRHFINQIEPVADTREVCQIIARQIRAMTGFNRTLIYRFGPDWNGTVIAEDGDGVLPSYLDLRFPASDIPAQARALYQKNRLRLIQDADYQPVPIDPPVSPVDGQKLDLAPATLRSVSPVHLQYMRNMATQASMSISLVADGRLWGLISCHHKTARHVGPRVRSACDFFGQLAAQQIVTRERMKEIGQRIALKRIETKLLVELARAETFQTGLVENTKAWLGLTNATGAAVVFAGEIHMAGITPPLAGVSELAAWLRSGPNRPVFATDCLSGEWLPAESFAANASGLLAVSISQLHSSYIMWFRQEQVHTVTWAGDPRKEAAAGALDPRASFQSWKELVRHKSIPWSAAEVEAAHDFRNAITDFVLRRAEERAALTEKLQLSNKELEAFSYSVSHDLRAPFRHIVGYADLLRDREATLDPTSSRFLDTIRDAALSAGQLVDDLLAFSQLSRVSMMRSRIDMAKLMIEARAAASRNAQDRVINWRIGALPEAWGDPTLVRQALINLLSNAVKYTGKRIDAEIVIEGYISKNETIYAVRDNGAGFDMRYVGKLFAVFQRLHRAEDFEGTGIGLALTKRVIDRHGGWIRAEAVEDKGATFTFALPRRMTETSVG